MEPATRDFPILLVDDDTQFLVSSGLTLRAAGISPVVTIDDSRQVLPFLDGRKVAGVVLDLSMPHLAGVDLLGRIKERYPELPVIVMTGRNEVDTAVACMKAGSFDYLVKPVENSRFVSAIRRAVEVRSLREEVTSLTAHFLSGELKNEAAFAGIVTRSRKLLAMFQYVEVVAGSRHPVLVTGETGVGKELVAGALHSLSGCKGEFVPVNVAGLEDAMFSDTLFGHRKGAYTGADQSREGLISKASGGTLFLDEIGDLRESSQVKLLRLLEEHRYYPLGSDVARESDARIVCATNRNLKQVVGEGKFRRDLFYRLSAHHVYIPPLRERPEDLPLLVDHFLSEAAEGEGKRAPTVPRELFVLLSNYPFPGNVRELRMMVFDAMLRHKGGVLSMDSFRKATGGEGVPAAPGDGAGALAAAKNLGSHPESRLPTLKEAEEYLIAEALARARNNQGIAASLLGITRQALNKRLIRGARGDREPEVQ